MYLSRIAINNFRNFSDFDIPVHGAIVIVGENRVGKSNLLFALRLIFDPTLPDSARQLGMGDFWDGVESPGPDDLIRVVVEIKDFEGDLDILALLTDFRLDDDHRTVRLTYEFRPKQDLVGAPRSDDDYEFVCFGGESETKKFGHDLRRRIALDLLPALRDAEGDLANWQRSPLRPLIERAFASIDVTELEKVQVAIEEATQQITSFSEVEELGKQLATLFGAMSGPRQDIEPSFGLGATDLKRLYRNVRLLIDHGRRGLGEASLGSANVLYLALKALELQRLMEENRRDHSILAIEEPEAHLHPHLQRAVYRHFFDSVAPAERLSLIFTTHSPHIASVAPLRSLVLLSNVGEKGTIGFSSASVRLTAAESEDLSRYLDVTRAEMLFARGVILVEGDAERFLVPVFAKSMGVRLDHLGITVCSVAGTNFQPYAKLLSALGLPFSIATDWDNGESEKPLGFGRGLNLVKTIGERSGVKNISKVVEGLESLGESEEWDEFSDECEKYGVFINNSTLESDLFKYGFAEPIVATFRERKLSAKRTEMVEAWKANPEGIDEKAYLSLIEETGKGRFAQRLASRIDGVAPPHYLKQAIQYVADRV
jgi:putative ATP-dependent endonuclease of OLD family